MSLKVWIPGTDGTLKNQGLLQLPSPSYNATSEATSGKLGKAIQGQVCYHLSSDPCPSLWSVACWSKFTSGYATYNNIILCLNTADSEDSKFYLSIINNTTLNIGRGASGTVAYSLPGNFLVNTWYHLAATFDGTTTKLYLNGSLVNSNTGGSAKSATNLTIGGRSTNANGTATTGAGWATNDVRIYDHCLTPQEVKEISKGLVAHYTLGSASLTSSGNLINGLAGGGLCTVSGNSINISGTNSDTYFYIKTTKAMTSGKLYRLSCIGSGFPASALYNFPIAGQSNTGPGLIKIKNGPCMLTFVANDACANAGTNIIMDDTSRTAGAGTISGLCLEEISSVSDSSGYSRNLSITGNVSTVDSVRYDKCIDLPVATTLSSSNPFGGLTTQLEWTISCWIKASTLTNWESKLNNFNSGNYLKTGDNLSILYLNSGTNDYYSYASGCPLLNQWCHVVYVFKNSTGLRQIWVNGVQKASNGPNKTSTPSGMSSTITWFQGYGGCVSDLRLYATALSADDVKDLYNLGALIS